MAPDLERLERTLAEKSRRLRAVSDELRKLFAERAALLEMCSGLERRLAVARRAVDLEFTASDGTAVVLDAKTTVRSRPPRGAIIAMIRDVLLLEGGPLHADEIVRRLEILGVRAGKKAVVAQLARSARDRSGFQRDVNRPNTFELLDLAKPEAGNQRPGRGARAGSKRPRTRTRT